MQRSGSVRYLQRSVVFPLLAYLVDSMRLHATSHALYLIKFFFTPILNVFYERVWGNPRFDAVFPQLIANAHKPLRSVRTHGIYGPHSRKMRPVYLIFI